MKRPPDGCVNHRISPFLVPFKADTFGVESTLTKNTNTTKEKTTHKGESHLKSII